MTPFQRYMIVREVTGREFAKAYGYGWSESFSDCFFAGCSVADAIEPTLGLVATYRDAYATLKGAHRAMRKRGFDSLSRLFQTHLEPIAPATALIGDLAVLALPDGEHVGVCMGDGFATKLPTGQMRFGIDVVRASFAVGGR